MAETEVHKILRTTRILNWLDLKDYPKVSDIRQSLLYDAKKLSNYSPNNASQREAKERVLEQIGKFAKQKVDKIIQGIEEDDWENHPIQAYQELTKYFAERGKE